MDNGASSYLRFLKGDDNAFVEIIRDYKDGLILYLNGFTGNIQRSEELAEDTFVKLVTKRPRFDNKASFKTWLYTIGRNVAIDSLRRGAKRKTVPLAEAVSLPDEEEELERAYIQEEDKIALHRAMGSLPSDYRVVLWLTYFEGFSNKEAAVVMKKSVRSVETLLYRARQKLKSELIKEGFVYEEL